MLNIELDLHMDLDLDQDLDLDLGAELELDNKFYNPAGKYWLKSTVLSLHTANPIYHIKFIEYLYDSKSICLSKVVWCKRYRINTH